MKKKSKTISKEEKVKREVKKIYQSTQQNIPIKDIVNGIVVTKNNDYVKIIEIKPSPFFLKTNRERNSIYNSFIKLLKSGPYNIQLKTMSINPDLTPQLNILDKEIAEETVKNCKVIDNEYRDRLIKAQEYGVSRRFFLIFSYTPTKTIGKKLDVKKIFNEIENISATLESYLKSMGNEIVEHKGKNKNYHIVQIFYSLFNRNTYKDISLEKRMEDVYNKYFEKFKKTEFYIPVTDYIAPKSISYNDSKYLCIDGMYYKYAYIPCDGYNTILYPGWINIFSNTFVGVDVDTFLRRMPREQIQSKIRRNMSYSISEADDATITSEAYDNANATLKSTMYLKNGLSNNEDFYYMSTLITVCDSEPEMVDYKMNELIKIAKSNDFILRELSFETENAFLSTIPLGNLDNVLFEKTKRNVLTTGAATAYPFTAYEINEEDGIYLGNNANDGSLIIADIFERKKITNSNMFICGQTGAGKTYTLLLMATRARIKHIPIFIIAPEKQNEFKRLCNAVGGQFVEFGPGSNNHINIMEIFKKNKEAEQIRMRIDGSYSSTSQLQEKVDEVVQFIQLAAGAISSEQKSLLGEAIIETYNRFGITSDNNSLWADETTETYKTMPLLEDLVDALQKKSKTEPSLKSIYNIMRGFIKTNGASYNGQTNIDINNEFVVFGLENISSEDIALGMYQAMNFCWSKIKQDATKKKLLFIDEWWSCAKNPVAAAYSQEISKLIRAYNGGLILATQQIGDIFLSGKAELGEAVLNNCGTKILMKMSELDAQNVQKIMHLTNRETENLSRNEKGAATLVYGTDKVKIKFTATATEHELITTNPKELEELARRKQQQEYQEQIREKIKNSRVLDTSLFNGYDYKGNDDVIMLDWKKLSKINFLNVPVMLNTKEYLELKEVKNERI